MHVILWEYQVKADRLLEFEALYSSEGAWVQLFKKHAGYRGTELLHDADRPQRYITIDRWSSPEAYNSFQAEWQDEYRQLDARCEDLTEGESFLGAFSGNR